jgi:hypothetical protein
MYKAYIAKIINIYKLFFRISIEKLSLYHFIYKLYKLILRNYDTIQSFIYLYCEIK